MRAFIMPKIQKEEKQMPKNRERQRANRRLKEQRIANKNAEGYSDRTASAAINSVVNEGFKQKHRRK